MNPNVKVWFKSSSGQKVQQFQFGCEFLLIQPAVFYSQSFVHQARPSGYFHDGRDPKHFSSAVKSCLDSKAKVMMKNKGGHTKYVFKQRFPSLLESYKLF